MTGHENLAEAEHRRQERIERVRQILAEGRTAVADAALNLCPKHRAPRCTDCGWPKPLEDR